MADATYIRDEIGGLYPKSAKLTPQYFAEMVVAFKPLSNHEFKQALEAHRGTQAAAYPPIARELVGKCGKVMYSEPKLQGFIAQVVIDYGWEEAIERILTFKIGFSSGTRQAMRDYCIRVGMTAKSEPFFGFPFWFQVFCDKLHQGDILDAYQYAVQECSEQARSKFMKALEFFYGVGNERSKLYFIYHKRQISMKFDGGKYRSHFSKFKLQRADDAYPMKPWEFNDYRNSQLDALWSEPGAAANDDENLPESQEEDESLPF